MLNKIKERLSKVVNTGEKTEEERIHTQYLWVLDILSAVSFFMAAVNVMTSWKRLAILTLIFGICCAIDSAIERSGTKNKKEGRVFFIAEMISLFTIFVILGEPEGFSPIWILLVPSCGFILFRMKNGIIISIVQLLILIFLLWTEQGNALLLYDYTDTFKMRFPIVFVAFAGIGIFFEAVRSRSSNDLKKANEKYKYMYNHDALTGLYNRYGFNKTINDFIAARKDEAFALVILDIDHFKEVNDNYGHMNGDLVLQEIARRVEQRVDGKGATCRWGGEEFSVLFNSSEDAMAILEEIMRVCNEEKIAIEDHEIIRTLSVGAVEVGKGQNFEINHLIHQVDENLYAAKNEGRNRIKRSKYKEEKKK